MSKREATKIRRQLEEKLEQLTGNKSRRDELITERVHDPMDQLQNRADLDLAARFVNTDFQTKRAVETALKVLNEGEYGVCQDCGDPINAKRLTAIPWTTLCISCQEEKDEVGGLREAA